MLKGSICAAVDDKEFLISLGVIIENYNYANKEFESCLVSNEAMEKLDKHWGDFFWSLQPVGTMRKTKEETK